MSVPNFRDRAQVPSRFWHVVYFAQCGHSQILKSTWHAVRGQYRWCKRCAESRQVLRVPIAWAVSCNNCRFGRFHAEDEHAAARNMTRHKNQHMTHTVILWRNGKADTILQTATARQIPGLGVGGLDDTGKIIPF